MAIEAGSIVEGVVTGITNFGAFVELPEKQVGLVHISEVADEYVRDVHDFLEENQKIKVKVMRRTRTTRRAAFILPLVRRADAHRAISIAAAAASAAIPA